MQRRDRYMVDHASLLIAAFDGTPGGTQYTMQYAMSRRVSIVDLPLIMKEL
jgi:GTP-binding protein EngB required for normal cell division